MKDNSQTELLLEKLEHCQELRNDLWRFVNEINNEKDMNPDKCVCAIIEVISAFEKLYKLKIELLNIGKTNHF